MSRVTNNEYQIFSNYRLEGQKCGFLLILAFFFREELNYGQFCEILANSCFYVHNVLYGVLADSAEF